jgi:hypothetical protein
MPTLTFKVTPAQAREVRRAARQKNLTVSDYLRRVALPAPVESTEAPRHDFTPGRVVIARAPGAPMITKERIDAALYDCP